MEINKYLSENKKYINTLISTYFDSQNITQSTLLKAMEYSMKAGGKRLRPILCLSTFNIYNDNTDKISNFLLAIEMIHTYSLIHDDLPAMDDDNYRRGKLTNHKKFGEAIAILAGDALLTDAFWLMANTEITGSNLIQAISCFSQAAGSGGMVSGQVLDIEAIGKEIDLNACLKMHANKTAALIKASIVCGALLAEAPKNHLAKLELFGENIGLAFQIMDDVLDDEESANMGKDIGSDKTKNKPTILSLLGKEKSYKLINDYFNKAIEALEFLDDKACYLKQIAAFIIKRKS
ncbi:MAG: polyprenyl synthetase family protein [Pseudomonadota bacterium]